MWVVYQNSLLENIITVFAEIVDRVANGFEQDAKNRRKNIIENKKRAYATLKKQMGTTHVLLVSGLLDETQVTDFLKYNCYSYEITTENAHKIRQTFGDYELTKEKELLSAEKGTVKVFVKFKGEYNGPSWYVVANIEADSPCRIVTSTYTSTNLVCDVD